MVRKKCGVIATIKLIKGHSSFDCYLDFVKLVAAPALEWLAHELVFVVARYLH